MARRRMFSLDVVDTDVFLDMPMSTQTLYFHLGMRADDEGFVRSPKTAVRTIGASEDDLRLLIAKGYVIPFDTGVVAIRHWKQNNQICPSRITPTLCREEKSRLMEDDATKCYELLTVVQQNAAPLHTNGIQHGSKMLPQYRIDKNRLEEDSIYSADAAEPAGKNNSLPSLEEVKDYFRQAGLTASPEDFCNYYQSVGWKIGRADIVDWRAAARRWKSYTPKNAGHKSDAPAEKDYLQGENLI